jgi:hypothetical protein
MVQIGRALGVPILKHVKDMESLWQESDKIHRLRLRAPEEDEYLFIHNFSTMKIWSFAAMETEAKPFIYFDDMFSLDEKDRIMSFYERCIKRHFFYHGKQNHRYLSKNPNFSPAVKTLLNRFPDSKFIYLVRNPMDAVPSHINLKDREWRLLGSPLKRYACKDFILESSQHWYDYPLNLLDKMPPSQAVIVKFEDLVSDAEMTIKGIYDKLGLRISSRFQDILHLETIKARNHISTHHYSLDEMGISVEEMRERFGSVMQRFEYSAD